MVCLEYFGMAILGKTFGLFVHRILYLDIAGSILLVFLTAWDWVLVTSALVSSLVYVETCTGGFIETLGFIKLFLLFYVL